LIGRGEWKISRRRFKCHDGAVARLLVERNDVEADSMDGYGRTPLSWAADRGHEAVVRLLVERDDVEADSKDNSGRTPLSWAAINGHEAVVRLLQSSEYLS
jgi:ankyrin repeat protein